MKSFLSTVCTIALALLVAACGSYPRRVDCEAHLKLLARIAEMFSDPELRVRLTTASTAAVAHSVFADWVVRHAQDPPNGKAAGQ